MKIKFAMHRRVFMELSDRKYHKNSERAALFVTFTEKGRKTSQR